MDKGQVKEDKGWEGEDASEVEKVIIYFGDFEEIQMWVWRYFADQIVVVLESGI